MKLHKFKRILKKDELLTIEAYANDKVNVVLEQIRAEIQENINYNKKMNYQGVVAGLLLTRDIIDKYR